MSFLQTSLSVDRPLLLYMLMFWYD